VRICGFAVVALVALIATVAAYANAPVNKYVLKHPRHERCKTYYVKKAKTVKRREHGRLIEVKETLCVYMPPKASGPAPTTKAVTPTSPALGPSEPNSPTPAVTLRVHLDPSFKQNPSNPLNVTYTYSASASVATLPAGILNLYSDGLLACSINVGGTATSGECPVTYTTTGAHKVVVTYGAGSSSTTETAIEEINPFTTTTTMSVVPESCETRPFGGGPACRYFISMSVIDQTGKSLTKAQGSIGIHGEAQAFYSFSGKEEVGHLWGMNFFPPSNAMACHAFVIQDVGDENGLNGSPDCESGMGASGPGAVLSTEKVSSWRIEARFGGSTGWTGSVSAPQEVTP
jgi:hypothetical protein